MEVPRNLRKRMPNESKGLAAFVHRELERIRWLAAAHLKSPAETKVPDSCFCMCFSESQGPDMADMCVNAWMFGFALGE